MYHLPSLRTPDPLPGFGAAWNLTEPISSSGHAFPLTLRSPRRRGRSVRRATTNCGAGTFPATGQAPSPLGREFPERDFARLGPLNRKRKTPNIQHRTSNIEHPRTRVCAIIGCWAFDVGCWLFPRFRGRVGVRGNGPHSNLTSQPSPKPSTCSTGKHRPLGNLHLPLTPNFSWVCGGR